jgi:putative transposase
MKLNRFGQIVQNAWFDLPKHYIHAELDAFCIMPNHVHGIIVLNEESPIPRHPLFEIVRAFKSFSARRINVLRKTPGVPVWQRNYYEHILRDHEDYLVKAAYIRENPLNWENDDENRPRG